MGTCILVRNESFSGKNIQNLCFSLKQHRVSATISTSYSLTTKCKYLKIKPTVHRRAVHQPPTVYRQAPAAGSAKPHWSTGFQEIHTTSSVFTAAVQPTETVGPKGISSVIICGRMTTSRTAGEGSSAGAKPVPGCEGKLASHAYGERSTEGIGEQGFACMHCCQDLDRSNHRIIE